MEYYSAIKKNTFESVLMRWMKHFYVLIKKYQQQIKHHLAHQRMPRPGPARVAFTARQMHTTLTHAHKHTYTCTDTLSPVG